MPRPSQPAQFIPRPFASGGTFATIPDSTTTSGRASFTQGFPAETQLPLRQGGIAPNRTDFNGMFNILSAFAFWQQSGGLWTYSASLNYAVPSIVYHGGQLWWCVAENGPEVTGVGAVEPGTDAAYWTELLSFMVGGDLSVVMGPPVGAVVMYPTALPPDGFFACNGATFSASEYPKLYTVLGSSILPDMRGYFVRGYDPTGLVDPDGANRAILSAQEDAMRNFTGEIGVLDRARTGDVSGAFYISRTTSQEGPSSNTGDGSWATLDPSRSVPTATENRPKNRTMLFCIKHD